MTDTREIYEYALKHLEGAQNESEVKQAWYGAFAKAGIYLSSEIRKKDASLNQVIIEYKDKGLFKGRTDSSKFKEAVDDRIFKYIKRESKEQGLPEEDFTGIVTDGCHICFCYMEKGKVRHQDLMPLSVESVKKFYKALKDDTRRALTPGNLKEDFGHSSQVGKSLMGALSEELELHFKSKNNNKIKMLFREWQSLFGQVAGISVSQRTQIRKAIGFSAPSIGDGEIAGLLFVIHTYNALIMKLLGAEIVSYVDMTQYKDFCGYLSSLPDNDLIETLDSDIENSGLFDAIGIKGFVEEAIFSWYLDAADGSNKGNIVAAIKDALIQISLYRMDNLTAARSQDVLKAFYQALVPDVLRKSLGEFYTPDWLVDVTCDRSNITKWHGLRVLDPTCGSGSFLLNAVARKRREAQKMELTAEETLDDIIKNVWGFDLNPLAVQASRVNFLIAISDLFSQCKGKRIELPVLLADSVYSPAKRHDQDGLVKYKIGSKQANLLITLPSELALDRVRLDAVFSVMGELVAKNEEFDHVKNKLLKRRLCSSHEMDSWNAPLKETYDQVLDLHRKNWNGIWFRIVRNFFWSSTAGDFDLVIGNPPWVRWSSLPEDYREKIKETCMEYTIFSDTKFHGGNELDISGMITYTVSDKWLRVGGRLVFVITQTHFQSPSSQGFRSFEINKSTMLAPVLIDDLKFLKPFADAANKTAIACFEKRRLSSDTIYPVPYNVWVNRDGYKKVIPEAWSKSAVLAGVDILQKEANPVDDIRSPWAIMKPCQFEKTAVIRGKSDWVQGRKGVTADLNGIYMVDVIDHDPVRNLVQIKTRPNAGKKNIGPSKKFWVEPDLLYPLIKGASDFSSCYFKPKQQLYIFVPNRGITKDYLLAAEELVEYSLPRTYKYFQSYEELLEERSTYKARLKKYAYYMIYNVGGYTFSPYKVIWAEQSGSFSAAVVGAKTVPFKKGKTIPYVPDHKIYFVDCYDALQAYFLCGLLSAPLVKEFVESHTISIQVSNIFKHLKLPEYNSDVDEHRNLAQLVKRAHELREQEERESQLSEIGSLADNIIEACHRK